MLKLKYMANKTLFYAVFLFCCFSVIGCATTPPIPPSPKPQISMPGVYHQVERGQTLWRISKMYNVDMDEIVRVNHIPDATSIEPGQRIFIPSAQQRKQQSYVETGPEDFAWPLKGRVIASFGQVYNDMVNKGLNIQKTDDQDVLASRSGKVIFYNDNFGSFGRTIIIDHGDGFSTVYARNSEVFVKAGDYVQKGAVIARINPSGRDRNPYLHFEIRKGYISQNPYFYLP